jgi:hypothetical protein
VDKVERSTKTSLEKGIVTSKFVADAIEAYKPRENKIETGKETSVSITAWAKTTLTTNALE